MSILQKVFQKSLREIILCIIYFRKVLLSPNIKTKSLERKKKTTDQYPHKYTWKKVQTILTSWIQNKIKQWISHTKWVYPRNAGLVYDFQKSVNKNVYNKLKREYIISVYAKKHLIK